MKKQLLFSIAPAAPVLGAALFLVASCTPAPQGPPQSVEIRADDKMRFDVTAFDAKPGQKISVTLKNVGTTPKVSMGHNFVILKSNVNEQNVQRFLDAASLEASHDYVPAKSGDVIAHTKLLGPGESDTVTFQAPFVAGNYLYLCSFPGHYSQGTKGFMTVK